ncbi:MAG: formylglycine-generating enzyme family protein [Bacteroidaceae bacterium]|nr:formylglycine-generating enzyme family protein [Bacteroidaceae bacterium]
MKKTSKFLLGALALLTFTACGGSNAGKSGDADSTAVSDPFEAAAGETKIVVNDTLSPLVFVPVKGGTFEMGDPNGQKHDDDIIETPAHKVTVSDFAICKTEVTQQLWQAVMGKNPSHEQDDPLKPVENVSWNDCQEFIKKLGQMTGHEYRLPTEAEWEYAARGGSKSKGTRFSGGDDVDAVANYHRDDNPIAGRLAGVGVLQANELGLFDMSGNAAEWTQDFYAEYTADEQTDPKGPATGDYYVYRGGHCNNNADGCTVTVRMKFNPVGAASYIGLRLVLVK